MPFDLVGRTLLPVDAAMLHGVPRHLLVAHAMAQLAPALRAAVADMEVSDGGKLVHMGMNFDRVAWRAVWRRPGLPAATGSFVVWNGEIV